MALLDLLKERNLPPLLPREEMKQILLENEYGFLPDLPFELSVSEPKEIEGRLCDGTAKLSVVTLTVKTPNGSHSFPVKRLLYEDGKKHPFFVFMNFRPEVPDLYYPFEEVAEEGFSVLSFCYTDVASDDGDFKTGIAPLFFPNGRTKDTDCGKLMLWSFAASRVMDYAMSIPSLDIEEAAVMGHSRLGKTALITGMLDERFRYTFSNDSGCSGAALCRGNTGVLGIHGKYRTGETIFDITKNFPYWFCERYMTFRESNIPENFDQHFLLATIAPRFAYAASSSLDDWADPVSEFMCCLAASPAYEAYGLKGLVADRFAEVDEAFHEGRIGYHLREGFHYLSRHDWHHYMAFIKRHQHT